MLTALIIATLLLAAANGGNDNIKGAATLLGAGLLTYRQAIFGATIATAMGGLISILIAQELLALFSGRGIVPDGLTSTPAFLLSVALAAGITVAIATVAGLPISTTHALVGGLLGAGLGSKAVVNFVAAATATALPLLLSPLIAMAAALTLVPVVVRLRQRLQPLCVCAVPVGGPAASVARVVAASDDPRCETALERSELRPAKLLDGAHLLSASAVSFARGLNDTPKIAALLVASGAADVWVAGSAVVLAMSLGAIAAIRVARTMAFKVTSIDAPPGLAANLVTSFLVIGASRLGLPVSTTHVSTGALFGIALGQRSGSPSVIRNILLAWLATLPIAALLAFSIAQLLRSFS